MCFSSIVHSYVSLPEDNSCQAVVVLLVSIKVIGLIPDGIEPTLGEIKGGLIQPTGYQSNHNATNRSRHKHTDMIGGRNRHQPICVAAFHCSPFFPMVFQAILAVLSMFPTDPNSSKVMTIYWL